MKEYSKLEEESPEEKCKWVHVKCQRQRNKVESLTHRNNFGRREIDVEI